MSVTTRFRSYGLLVHPKRFVTTHLCMCEKWGLSFGCLSEGDPWFHRYMANWVMVGTQ